MELFVLMHLGEKRDTYKQRSPTFNSFGPVCLLCSGGFCAVTQQSITPCKAHIPGETGRALGLPDHRARTLADPPRWELSLFAWEVILSAVFSEKLHYAWIEPEQGGI